jgi:shikimate dehydrogenase
MNGAFKELNIDANFETLDLPPEDLPAMMERLKSGELAGLITTMPFKTPSLDFLDGSTAEVKTINAVNLTLAVPARAGGTTGIDDGKLFGYNTDYLGAIGAMKVGFPDLASSPAQTTSQCLKGLKILVLGCGGAARAAAYGFHLEGAEVFLWNRTPEKAAAYAEKIGINFVPDFKDWPVRPDAIVNATALSNQDRQSTIVPYVLWEKAQVAMDAVYGKTSLFLEEARAAKIPHIFSGELWFLKQIFPIFELITGQKAPEEFMTRLTAESKNIAC